MTTDDLVFTAFSDFGIGDIPVDATVAHAVAEFETQLTELKKKLVRTVH